MGVDVDLNIGITFSRATASASRNCFIHSWRAWRLSFLMRPEAACSTAPRMAPGWPTSPSEMSRFLPTVR